MYNNSYSYYPYMNMSNFPQGMGIDITKGGMGALARPRSGLLKSFSNIKWGEVLNNTQKTLNVINQAIPVYYQIKPIVSNVKSLGRLVTAFNEPDDNFNNTKEEKLNTKKENSNNSPTFFIN